MRRLLCALGLGLALASCRFDLTNLTVSGCTKATLVDSTRTGTDTTVRVDTVHAKVCAL